MNHPAAAPTTTPSCDDDRAGPHHETSCRARSACASVTPSTYSRSPPIGSPRASRVTRTPKPREQLLDVGGRDLALHRRIGGQNDLSHPALANPPHQMVESKRLRTDAVERREPSAKHMIASPEIGRAIYHRHCRGFLHHTEDPRIATGIAADEARLVFGRDCRTPHKGVPARSLRSGPRPNAPPVRKVAAVGGR